MSVTVADLLKLPSLKPARVLAGAGGLSRTVAYVSVLEYANPQILEDDLFPGDTYSGSEIVITGFMNNPADQRLQCAVVRRLAEAGEVGLILYYVGVYVPAVPEEMKRIADEKDFVLIQMPEKRMDFRYGEAICEIMERIVRDPHGESRLCERAFRAGLPPAAPPAHRGYHAENAQRAHDGLLSAHGRFAAGPERSHLAPQPGQNPAGLSGGRKSPGAGGGGRRLHKRLGLPALPRVREAGPEPPDGAFHLPGRGTPVPLCGGTGRGRGAPGRPISGVPSTRRWPFGSWCAPFSRTSP